MNRALQSFNDPSQDAEAVLASAHLGLFICLVVQPFTHGSPVLMHLFGSTFWKLAPIFTINLVLGSVHLVNCFHRIILHKAYANFVTLFFGVTVCSVIIIKAPENITSGVFLMILIIMVGLPLRKFHHYVMMLDQVTDQCRKSITDEQEVQGK